MEVRPNELETHGTAQYSLQTKDCICTNRFKLNTTILHLFYFLIAESAILSVHYCALVSF